MTTGIADIIIVHNGRVLLVQQRKPKVYGTWGFPGGHIEEGESADSAIEREVAEELGISISASGRAKIEHKENSGDEGVLSVATFVLSSDVFLPQLQAEELIGFGWFTSNDLKEMADRLRSSWMIELVDRANSRSHC